MHLYTMHGSYSWATFDDWLRDQDYNSAWTMFVGDTFPYRIQIVIVDAALELMFDLMWRDAIQEKIAIDKDRRSIYESKCARRKAERK